MFRFVSYYLGAFGTVWLPYETRAKLAELAQKFVPRGRVGFFHNERTRSNPLTLNRHFGAFRTIWVHSVPFGCLTKLVAKRAELCKRLFHEVALEFFTTNAPDPPHWTLT